MKLRTKVFLSVVSTAIFPLLIVSIFAYHRYIVTTHDRMDELSTSIFNNAIEAANLSLESIKETSGLFTFYSDGSYSIVDTLYEFSDSNKQFSNYDIFKANNDIKFACQNVFYSQRAVYGIYVFTPAGPVLGHSAGMNRDVRLDYDPTNAQWYKDTIALDGAMYVSNLGTHSDIFTGESQSIYFAQSLKDVYSHKFLGVLLIDCNPSILDISLNNTMPDITLFTIDNTNTDCVLYTNIDNLNVNFSKDSRAVFHEKLAIPSLRLTAVFDYEMLFREFNTTGILIILVTFICIIIAVILTSLLSYNLVSPIEHLSRKMSDQRGNQLDQSTRYLARNDEIGTLYYEYNKMVDKINLAIKKDYQDRLVLLDAQMKSLEARINSHFLFNTLESINSMAELADNDDIATMSLALGNMFRYTIKTESEIVTIGDELSHVIDYVSIQRIRFSNRFVLKNNIPTEYDNLKVLKLILQPIVENSLFHGLNYCASGDLIELNAQIKDSILILSVRDNGAGIEESRLLEIQESLKEDASFTELGHRSKQSIGLKNIHSRIELYYGKGYGLSIESQPGNGATVFVKLPIIEEN